jgi:DNA-directed RNA polymerase specialized sigma24 family protein
VEHSAEVERARRGDRDAFEALFEEHAPGTWRLALAVRPEPDAAGAAVAGAFGKVLAPPRRRSPIQQAPVRLQLLSAAREAAITADPTAGAHLATSGTTLVAPSLPGSSTVGEAAVDAFERLPERWRSVLWLTEVEGLDLHDAAAVIGLSVEATTELAGRAHAGFREQYAKDRVGSVTEPDCQLTAARLGEYVSGALSTRNTARVRRHLDGCDACRQRLDEIDDLPPRLRRAIPVLPVAVLGLAEAAWATHIDEASGPLGLILPGGRPMPPWAERALAGATAAVVTLGITGAILAGGRGGKDRSPQLADRATEQPLVDGESALSSGQDGSTDGGLDGSELAPTDELARVPTATGAPTTTTTTADEVARGGPTTTTTTPGVPVTPSSPPAPSAPDPVDPTDPSVPPASSTPPVVAVRIDDGTGVSVGGSCTGVEVLTVVVGCEPADEGTLPLLGP